MEKRTGQLIALVIGIKKYREDKGLKSFGADECGRAIAELSGLPGWKPVKMNCLVAKKVIERYNLRG